MSKITDAIAVSQNLSSTAAEEALRCGHPAIDLDHLLLGISTLDDPAGRLLRAEGADLTRLREACRRVHDGRVAELGLTPPALEPVRVPDPASVRSDFAPRALAVMRQVRDYSSALPTLAALIEEPSGLVRDVLREAGVDRDQLRGAIGRSRDRTSRGRGVGASAFIPAEPERVWDFVTDIERRPEWDPNVGRVQEADGGTWDMWAPTHGPDGSKVTVKPAYRRRQLRVLGTQPGRVLEWALRWPDSSRPAHEQLARIELTAEGKGTHVRLTYSRRPVTRWQALLRPILGPLARQAARQHARLQLAGISRALR